MKRSPVIVRFLNWSICRARGDNEYSVDTRMTSWSALRVVATRLLAMVRGVRRGFFIKKYSFPLFIGRRVIIKHPRLLELGKSVVIDDFAFVDALSSHGCSIGDGTTIEKNVLIRITGVISNLGEGVEIGSRCSIGAFSFLGAAGGVRIGNNVLIGQRVSLHAENHLFGDRSVPIRSQGVSREGISIEDNCWIGTGTIILDGVTVGEGSVIGAGSVVVESIPPNSVAVGVPARVIKERTVQMGTK